jgi:hypothetical protein
VTWSMREAHTDESKATDMLVRTHLRLLLTNEDNMRVQAKVTDAWVVYLGDAIMGVYPKQENAQQVFDALKDPEMAPDLGAPRIQKAEIREW